MTAALLQSVFDGSAPELVPIKVDQYHRMITDGILPEGAAIELIDGFLVKKDRGSNRAGDFGVVRNSRHAGIVAHLQILLNQALANSGFHVRSQLPVTLDHVQEPEPDLAVVRGAARDYLSKHPGPADIALIIEVADSSLKFDRGVKYRLYASASIQSYWIVNLLDETIESYSDPDPVQQCFAVDDVQNREGTLTVTTGTGEPIVLAVGELLPV